ncbi:hemolysin III [Hyphomicrobium sp. 1Nfss2.1]|uniref:PAQR family membrane homeostasis protein TrhA n=1 Tax=Hyphomicrobium sp. 1Nfss2.1 TaxID=3413936 RepID=UPI003C7C9810
MASKQGCVDEMSEASIFPSYTRSEVIADGIVHATGLAFAVTAVVALIILSLTRLDPASSTAVLIYGTGMLAVFVCSAAYNLSRSRWRWLLRRLDHAAIFIKIAATYTPFAAIKLGGGVGIGLLVAVWAIAIIGASAKLIAPAQFVRTAYVLYLAQGWAAVFTLPPLFAALPATAFTLLLVGGMLYTMGVVFHLWERLPYNNAIWHVFVLAASACHFGAVVSALT